MSTGPSPEQQAKLDEELAARLRSAEFQDRPAQNEVPRGAVRVPPYKPNRKQRRAQAALKRKK